VSRAILEWFEPRRRAYPWRGERDPYRVLVSEVMLQQTQAARVVPHYVAFVRRFPTVDALASAPRSEVIRAWAGLGYNRRAVALSESARAVVRDHGGSVPTDPERLRQLPGVGPYTADAVASLAFGAAVPAMDTNVRRVVARARMGLEVRDVRPSDVGDAARSWIDRRDPGAWNQAVMDLGREVCRPVPRCGSCPIARTCAARRAGRVPVGRPPRWRAGADAFEGSSRQLRGRIVAMLREHGRTSVGAISTRLELPPERIAEALAGLRADGLVAAGPAAVAGRPRGRVALAR
jgi:A/G-specific adenine glycosylase